ncbi:hypothetical protein GQ600_14101 [Phytophthora cactorum]|nr:hypothetical protein GQ600_14101 [Phytophthora cactorum]
MEALIPPRVREEYVVVVQRQTRTFDSSLVRSLQAASEEKVEQVAKKAEASRWGWFARSSGQGGQDTDEDMNMEGESRGDARVTKPTSANMPRTLVHRDSTKKEKKAFMDDEGRR